MELITIDCFYTQVMITMFYSKNGPVKQVRKRLNNGQHEINKVSQGVMWANSTLGGHRPMSVSLGSKSEKDSRVFSFLSAVDKVRISVQLVKLYSFRYGSGTCIFPRSWKGRGHTL